MPKIQQIDVAAKVRQMGYEDFFCDCPQSWASHFFGPTSLAYQHWIEGWEQAQVEAYSAMQEEKAKWIVEQEKRNYELCRLI